MSFISANEYRNFYSHRYPTFSGVTILLSLTVFHNILTESLPQVSDAMPLLGTFCFLVYYSHFFEKCKHKTLQFVFISNPSPSNGVLQYSICSTYILMFLSL